MSNTKTYTISPFDLKAFKKSVRDSLVPYKMTLCEVNGDQVETTFAASLNASEWLVIDDLAANHTGEPLPDTTAETADGIPKVVALSEPGNSVSVVSHDWTKKTTWYSKAQQRTGEVAELDHDGFWNLATRYDLIDLKSGDVTFEDKITGYDQVVYNDGVVIPDSEITWDYHLGRFEISAQYQIGNTIGTITADVWISKESDFYVNVPQGVDKLMIKSAECQFSSDVQTQPIYFEVQAEVAPDTWVAVESNLHNSVKDIINIARQGTGRIPRCDRLKHDVLVFPIHYDRPIELTQTPHLRIVVRTKDHKPMSGEWATITFYTEYD